MCWTERIGDYCTAVKCACAEPFFPGRITQQNHNLRTFRSLFLQHDYSSNEVYLLYSDHHI